MQIERWVRAAGIGLLLLAGAVRARAALTAEEQAIAAWFDGRQEEMVALLERAVKIDSRTENHAGVKEVGALFAAELTAAGFRTRWIDQPAELDRGGHLLAERTGTRGNRLLLIGHLDVVLHGG